MNIGDLFFSLRANDARLQADVKKAGATAGNTLGKSLNNSFRSQFSGKNLGQGIAQGLGLAGGLGIANAAAAAAQAVVGFAQDSIEAASNLNEILFTSQKVFGDHSAEMEKWAETGAEAFGLSKRGALEAATAFAGLFKVAGFGIDEAAEKARTLTDLAGDLSSTFNTDVAEAVTALRSGLSGESEPLRRFNVFLSETAVSSELVAMGQKKVNGQWTEAQKQLARYNIIMEQTIDAQGVFGSDVDSLADKQRILNAELENAQAALGQELIPLQLEATQVLRDAIPVLIDMFHALQFVVDGWGALIDNLHLISDPRDLEKGLGRTGHSLNRLRGHIEDTGDATVDIGVDARDARKAIGDMGDEMYDTADAAEDLEAALDDLTDAASDAGQEFSDTKFSATELAGRMSELEQEIIDAKEELAALKAIEDPTAEQRRDIAITRGEIAGMEHDLFDTRLELALLNGTGLDGLLKDLAAAQYRTDLLGKEAREALTIFQKLSFAQGKVSGFTGDPGFAPRAGGGDVRRGSSYLVGERGPEMYVPDTNGTIYSTADTMRGWGGGNTYEYHIHGEGQLKIPDPLAAANTLARFQGAGLLPEAD